VICKMHGWLFISPVQPDKTQKNYTPSEISWRVYKGVSYDAKPNKQQKLGAGLLTKA